MTDIPLTPKGDKASEIVKACKARARLKVEEYKVLSKEEKKERFINALHEASHSMKDCEGLDNA